MSTIHCKNCGAFYRYETEGCCPRCGAYNRPPAREKVNADGTVRHMSEASFAKHGGGGGKVCFEEKECHEQKACYEEQGRRYRTVKKTTSQSGEWSDGKSAHGSAAQSGTQTDDHAPQRMARRRSSASPGAVIALAVAAVAVFNFVNNLHEDAAPERDDGYVTELTEEAEFDVNAELDEQIPLSDGTTLCVVGGLWDQAEEAHVLFIERTYPEDMSAEERAASDDRILPQALICSDEEGYYTVDEWMLEGGACTFQTGSDALMPEFAVFTDNTGDEELTICVRLDWA